MPERTVIWVKPDGDGGWIVIRQGAERAIGLFNNKADAIEKAKEVAKNNKPSQVIIQKRDGTIETEHTYGNDPYPPVG